MNLYQPTISGSLTVSGSVVVSGSITMSSGSISGTASLAENSLLLNSLDSSSFVGTGSYNTFSGSVSSRLVTQENASGSFAAQSASLSTRVTNLEATSSTVSSSFASTSGSIAGRVNIIETSYATTGSNNFTAPQHISDVSNAISFTSTASLYTDGGLRVTKDSFISGTAYFNNVVVYGTSSIEYITSSQLAIGTNIITLNTDTPAIRYGGISVFDSGSNNQSTGSLFWDSEKDKWIYSNPSGSTYDGGMLISGPRNSSGLGNEVGTTSCALMMGQGGDHITSSGIFSYSNATCFYGTTFISSSGASCFGNRALFYVPESNSGVDSLGIIEKNTLKSLYLGASGGYGWIQTHGTVPLYINELGNNVVMALNSNVGVGTSTVSARLHVSGSSNSSLLLVNSPGASGALFVSGSGNVGIGCTTPGAILDINSVAALSLNVNSSQNTYIRLQKSGTSFGDVGNAESLASGGCSCDLAIHARSTGNIVFATNFTERARITNAGVACFSGRVCASALSADGANIRYADFPNYSFQIGTDTFSGGWYVYQPAGYRFTIKDGGVAVFACQVCTAGLHVGGCTFLGGTGNAQENPTRLGGTSVYNGVACYGSYGKLLFNANTNLTGGALRYLLTNALDGNKFGFVRSSDANTDPSLGVNGNVSSGTATMVFDGGNVGIANTTPCARLHVTLPAYTSEDTDSQQVIFGSGTAGYGVRIGYNESTNIGYINSLKPNVAWSSLSIQANSIIFAPSAIEKVRITNSGIACFACQVCTGVLFQNQPTGKTLSIVRNVDVSPSTTGYMSIDLADYMGTTYNLALDVTAGAYGNSNDGPGIFKFVFGGFYSTAGGGACAILANVITNGSWAWNRNGTVYCVALTNTGSQTKFASAKFTISFNS